MNPEIVKNPDSHILDFVKDSNIVALTLKNAFLIEGIVSLDSRYRRDAAGNLPDENYDPIRNRDDAKGLYCGSSVYWFGSMNKATTEEDFRKVLQGAVNAVDRANTTHLTASVEGRKKMADIIYDQCHDVNDLRCRLNEEYSVENENHILNLMLQPPPAIKESNQVRYNLSFASKFCCYAADYFNADYKYPKYDGVVASNLPQYAKLYLGRRVKKTEFQTPSNQTNRSWKDYGKVYKKYADCIRDILLSLKDDCGIELTMQELDHIIWYTSKSR